MWKTAATAGILLVALGGCAVTQPKTTKTPPKTKIAKSSPAPLPLLDGEFAVPSLSAAEVKVKASWGRVTFSEVESYEEYEKHRELFASLTASQEEKSYKSREFQPFLPNGKWSVGSTWKISNSSVAALMRQLNPNALEGQNVQGGESSHAVLRAVSDTHFDICLRLHVQFEFVDAFFLTPAQLSGHLLVNSQTGAIDYFSLSVPDTKYRNAAFEKHSGSGGVGLGNIAGMSLSGGDEGLLEKSKWTDEIPQDVAEAKLARSAYAMNEIRWLPPKEVLGQAQTDNKPIFAVVLEGALGDQSC